MSQTRKLQRRQQNQITSAQGILGSLEKISVTAEALEALRLELLEKAQGTQDLLSQVDALREGLALLLPYVQAPIDVESRVLDLLKVP